MNPGSDQQPFGHSLEAFALGIGGVLLFAIVGSLAGPGSGGVLGAIRGEDGRLSSSKFQFFLWTAVVIFTWVSVNVAQALSTAKCAGAISGALPNFPTNVLLAMGFSVTTLATAKGVTTSYVLSGRMAKSWTNRFALSDLVCQDDGRSPDLTKIQMLTWTVIASASYLFGAVHLVNDYLSIGAHPACGIPDIDTALMALMGIGQGAYLGSKIVGSPSIVLRSPDKPQTSAGDTIAISGSGFGTVSGSVYFGSVAAALAPGDSWNDNAVKVIVPAIDSSDNKPFSPGDTVAVGIALTGADASGLAGNTLPFTYAVNQPPAKSQAPVATGLSLPNAITAVRVWLQEQVRLRTIAEGEPPKTAPVLYRLSQMLSGGTTVMSVTGPITSPKPARYAFFVDHMPAANWEHWCTYVFVADDGGIFAVESIAPPSSRDGFSITKVDDMPSASVA
jgi:hypothetical protein